MKHVSAGTSGCEGRWSGQSEVLRREDAVGASGTEAATRCGAAPPQALALAWCIHSLHCMTLGVWSLKSVSQSRHARRQTLTASAAQRKTGSLADAPDSYKRSPVALSFLSLTRPHFACLHSHSPSILSSDAPVSHILKQRAAHQPHRPHSIVAAATSKTTTRFV
jgi:hypothetical protein